MPAIRPALKVNQAQTAWKPTGPQEQQLSAEQDFHLVARDGTSIQGTVWLPARPRALLLFLHGFAEHRRRYRPLARWLVQERFGFASIDLRGHGESSGRPGFILKFEDYYQDVLVFLHWAREHFQKVKLFVGAHSLGSLISIRFFQSGLWQHKIQGLVLSAPFLGFFRRIPLWQSKLLHAFSEAFPGLPFPGGIDPDLLTRNSEAVMSYRFDPYIFRRPRLRWLTEVMKAQKAALARAPFLPAPALILQGLADRITSVKSSRRFYDMLEVKSEWLGYDDMYHEVLNEPEYEKVFKDIKRWMKEQL